MFIINPVKTLRKFIHHLICRTPGGYRSYLARNFGTPFPPPVPAWPASGTVLRTKEEHRRCSKIVQSLHLPSHQTPEKNWDSLVALKTLLTNVPVNGRVLDAGGTTDSVILPWLFAYGFSDLTAINLDIGKTFSYGSIRYRHGDLTNAQFPDGHFNGVVCQSVIEHGVDPDRYLREMARLITPGGFLITSTDYWKEPIDTSSIRAFGAPFRIYTPADMRVFVAKAAEHGLQAVGDISYECDEKAVTWDEFGLSYTFFCLILQKGTGKKWP